MKTCFVSMPLGIKKDPYTGRQIDFNNIYIDLIKPAVLETEISVYRIDEEFVGIDMMKSIISAAISSDIMIADLTTQNPNVMYELGMRHVAQRGLTIMICSSDTRIPFNISNFRVISYQLNDDGTVSEDSRKSFQQLLRYSIESNLDITQTDSPVYQLFPDLRVQLPEGLASAETKRVESRKAKKRFAMPVSSSLANQSVENLKEIQSEVLGDSEVDPSEFVGLLKRYRDISAWKDLVELAESAPDMIKKNPEVQQLYALALNRLGEKEKAIDIMEKLVSQTGGDPETFGILGRIYKDLCIGAKDDKNEELAIKYLDKAIHFYKAGFEKQPNEYYNGVNLVNLLTMKRDSSSADELNKVLPRVRESVKNSAPNYWTYATGFELSSIAGDWAQAEEDMNLSLQQNPESWMLQTTLQNLTLLHGTMNADEKSKLEKLMSQLKERSSLKEGPRYA